MVRFEGRGGVEEASRGGTPPQAARLLIADDHALVREGLRTMLSGEEGIEVVAEANDGQQALPSAENSRPDLVLMDVRMPVMDGLEATRRIKARDARDERGYGHHAREPRLPLRGGEGWGCWLRPEGRFRGEAVGGCEEDVGG